MNGCCADYICGAWIQEHFVAVIGIKLENIFHITFLIDNELDGYMDSVYTLLSTHLTHYKVFFEPNVIRIKNYVYTKRITNFLN